MAMKLVVAGATGTLGGLVTELAVGRHQVTVLGRDAQRLERLGAHRSIVVEHLERASAPPPELVERLRGTDCVFSCIGASVQPTFAAERRSFWHVDAPCNERLVEAAKQAGVRKFVYVAVPGIRHLKHLEYAAAHERVVQALSRSGLEHAIVRPTGFFSAFLSILELAEKGIVPLLGTPDAARTNPIDDRDLAEICLEAVESSFGDQEVGGPEVFTRRQLAEKAFEALGKPSRTRLVPTPAVKLGGVLIRPFNPRLAAISRFYLAISSCDCIAPARGRRTIDAFFAEQLLKPAPAARHPSPTKGVPREAS